VELLPVPKPIIAPPIDRLRSLFDYDPATGVLTRRMRTQFATERAHRIWTTRFAGKPVEGKAHNGYLRVSVTIDGVVYRIKAHRLIWALVHGY
jgi:hypothetical protein